MFDFDYTIKSNAKVTLYHDIVYPRVGCYWNIQSFVLPIDLYDLIQLRVRKTGSSINITCNHELVKQNEQNICYKAVSMLINEFHIKNLSFDINIIKNIPVSSGLGGGSSNVTSLLVALNEILHLDLDIRQVSDLALKVSRDSFYFCYSRPAFVKGIADKICILPDNNFKFYIAIIDPNMPFIHDKSKFVMERVVKPNEPEQYEDGILSAWLKKDIKDLNRLCYNFITKDLVPEYQKAFIIQGIIKKELDINFVFSGTGPFLVSPIQDTKVIDRLIEIGDKFDFKIYIHDIL